MGIKHAFTSGKVDSPDATIVRPTNWNADHTIDGDVDLNGHALLQPKLGGNLNPNGFGSSAAWSPSATNSIDLGSSSLVWRDLYLQNMPTIKGRKLFPCVFPVSQYGAVCNGTTDDLVAIQAAVNAAQANHGGIVLFDQPCDATHFYLVTGTIFVSEPCVKLVGFGCYIVQSGTETRYSPTRVVWGGATNDLGAVIAFLHSADAQYPGLARNGAIGIEVDCASKATYGIFVKSVMFSQFEDLYIKNPFQYGLYLVAALSFTEIARVGGNQRNTFTRVHTEGHTAASNGIFISGSSFNTFIDCHTETGSGGVGWILDNCDNITFINCSGYSGAGYSWELRSLSVVDAAPAYCDACYFIGCTWSSMIIRGTESGAGSIASQYNEFIGYDSSNFPPITTGTGVKYFNYTAGFTLSWIPVISSSSGSITTSTTAVATYRLLQAKVEFTWSGSISNAGTASGTLDITLPTPALNRASLCGTMNPGTAMTPLVGYIETNGTQMILQNAITQAFPGTGTFYVSGWYHR